MCAHAQPTKNIEEFKKVSVKDLYLENSVEIWDMREVELEACRLFIDNLFKANYADNKQIFETDPYDDIMK